MLDDEWRQLEREQRLAERDQLADRRERFGELSVELSNSQPGTTEGNSTLQTCVSGQPG